MDLGLKNKTALVLAASKGLGRACAEELAREGANVVIASRDCQRLEQTAREIGATAVAGDVSIPEQIQTICDWAVKAFGRVDILVNNAGGPPFGSFDQFTDEQWMKALELNLMSAVRFNRLVLPAMKEARWGRIVNIVSFGTRSVLTGSMLSTAGRLGIIGMSKLLSEEVAPLNITVNNVAPGIILTDRVRETSLKNATEEEVAARVPMKRLGDPKELAALVAFLASERASYITGSTIAVDGGIVRSI